MNKAKTPILDAFHRALRREAHNLSERPDLTWQQLFNRLQWEKAPTSEVVAAECRSRTIPGGSPWMRTRMPFRESNALMRTLHGHTDRVFACAVSPDAEFVVSASWDGTLKLWDPVSGRELSTLDGEAGPIECATGYDGVFLVSAARSGLRFLDPTSGEQLRTLESQGVECLAIGREAALLLSAGSRELRLWDLASGEEIRRLESSWLREPIFGCALSPCGAFAVSAGELVLLWDTANGEMLQVLHGDAGHTAPVQACAISPDGSLVVTASKDGTLKLWDPLGGQELRTLRGHTRSVTSCAASPNGRFVVSASWDGTLRLWDPASGTELRSLAGHSGWIDDCAVSPDGSFVVSASQDGTLKLWDPSADQDLQACAGHVSVSDAGAHVSGCAFSPDGAFLVSASFDGTLKLWNPASGEELRTLKGHAGRVSGCAVSPDAAAVVSVSEDRSLRIWDPSNGAEVRSLEDVGWFPTWVVKTRCAVSGGGSLLVSEPVGGDLSVWESASGALLRTLAHHDCAVSADGFAVAINGADGLRFWDPATGQTSRSLGTVRGQPLAVSPDWTFVILTGPSDADHALMVWEAANIEQPRLLDGHTNAVQSCAVSPDGRLVASASLDGTLRLWNIADGRELTRIPVGADLHSVALHPWLPFAACGSAAGEIYLLDLVGVEYGPIRVTAQDLGSGPVVRCPACWLEHPLVNSWCGSEMACPNDGCDLRLHVNSPIEGPVGSTS